MPHTAAHYGVSRHELFNEDINIQVGLYYLKDMFRLFHDRDLSLAAYNSGPTTVINAGYRIPRIKETITYVRRVNRVAQRYEREGFSS